MRHKVMFLIAGVLPVLALSALVTEPALSFKGGPYQVDVFIGGILVVARQ